MLILQMRFRNTNGKLENKSISNLKWVEFAAELPSTTSSSSVSTLRVNEADDSADIQISKPIAMPEAVALTDCAWLPKNTAGPYGEKIGNGGA